MDQEQDTAREVGTLLLTCPNCSPAQFASQIATPTGLEPATSDVTGRRSKPTELRSRAKRHSSDCQPCVNNPRRVASVNGHYRDRLSELACILQPGKGTRVVSRLPRKGQPKVARLKGRATLGLGQKRWAKPARVLERVCVQRADLHNPFRIGARFCIYLGWPDNNVGQPRLRCKMLSAFDGIAR